MKNLQCDICSKQVQYKFQLNTLREIYQTEDIVQICEGCGSDINQQLYKIQNKCWGGKIEIEDISKELKEHIVRLKGLSGFKTEGFWSRWFG